MEKIDRVYMSMALDLAKASHAVRRKVGCLIVKDRMIISEGVNGTIPGFSNSCEYLEREPEKELSEEGLMRAFLDGQPLITKEEVVHAEMNAILKIARSSQNSDGATAYVTLEPCIGCAKSLVMAGIKRVVYYKSYRQHEGIELLKKAGIEVEKISSIYLP